MPQIGNIAITDAEATPVTHTFTPVKTEGAIARLKNSTGAATTPGNETLIVEVRDAKSPKGANQVVIGMGDPTEAVVDGQTSVVRTNSMQIVFNFAQTASVQERKNLGEMASKLLANATVKSVIENLEPIY